MIIAIVVLAFIAGMALGSLVSYYTLRLPPFLEAEDQPEPALPAELQRLQADNARLKETADFYLGLYSETMQLRKTQ